MPPNRLLPFRQAKKSASQLALEKALIGIWIARDGLLDFGRAHEVDCDCDQCDDADGVFYMVRMIESALVANMSSFPSDLKKLVVLGEIGFPSAAELTSMLKQRKEQS